MKSQTNLKNLKKTLFTVWDLKQWGRALPCLTSAGNVDRAAQGLYCSVHVLKWLKTPLQILIWELQVSSNKEANSQISNLQTTRISCIYMAFHGALYLTLHYTCKLSLFINSLFQYCCNDWWYSLLNTLLSYHKKVVIKKCKVAGKPFYWVYLGILGIPKPFLPKKEIT